MGCTWDGSRDGPHVTEGTLVIFDATWADAWALHYLTMASTILFSGWLGLHHYHGSRCVYIWEVVGQWIQGDVGYDSNTTQQYISMGTAMFGSSIIGCCRGIRAGIAFSQLHNARDLTSSDPCTHPYHSDTICWLLIGHSAQVLWQIYDACITWPDVEEMEEYAELIGRCHPTLAKDHGGVWEGAFGSIDGLNCPIASSEDPELENASYNGWLHAHVWRMFRLIINHKIWKNIRCILKGG